MAKNLSVQIASLEKDSRNLGNLSSEVNRIKNRFSSIRGAIDGSVRNRMNINGDLNSIMKDLDREGRGMGNLASFLKTVIRQYENTEKELKGLLEKADDKSKTQNKGLWGFCEKLGEWFGKNGGKLLKIYSALGLLGPGGQLISSLLHLKEFFGNKENNAEVIIEKNKVDIPPLKSNLSYNPSAYNEDVLLLQKRLNELGYTDGNGNKLKEDGKFGKRTLEAVNKFKEENKLWNFDQYAGIVGTTTWTHLFTNMEEAKSDMTYQQNIEMSQSDTVNAYYKDIDNAISNIKNCYGSKKNFTEFEDALYIQMYLWILGYDLGSSGPAGIGVDGDLGKKSKEAIQKAVADEITDLKGIREILKLKVAPILQNRAHAWSETVNKSGSLLDKNKYPIVDPLFYVFFQKQHQKDIDPVFAGRLAAFAKDNKLAIFVGSGFRSYEEQVNSYINSGGYKDKNGNWVGGDGTAAKPGNSWHNFGEAIDISWNGEPSSKLLRELYGHWASTEQQTELTKYGIFKPLTSGNKTSVYEEWHLQPIETAGIYDKDERKKYFDAYKTTKNVQITVPPDSTDENKPSVKSSSVPQIAGEDNLGYLSGIGESNNDPGLISTGKGDQGGKSYGAFQFASTYKIQISFMYWLKDKNSDMYSALKKGYDTDDGISGTNFDSAWKKIAEQNRDEFLKLQYLYTKYQYYDTSAAAVKKETVFDFNARGYALKNVLWSRAVHHGSGGVIKVIKNAFERVDINTATDEQIIKAIYAESGAAVDDGKYSITESNFARNKDGSYAYKESTRTWNIKFAKDHGIYGKYMKYFSGNSTEVQVGVWNRLNIEEPEKALDLLLKY